MWDQVKESKKETGRKAIGGTRWIWTNENFQALVCRLFPVANHSNFIVQQVASKWAAFFLIKSTLKAAHKAQHRIGVNIGSFSTPQSRLQSNSCYLEEKTEDLNGNAKWYRLWQRWPLSKRVFPSSSSPSQLDYLLCGNPPFRLPISSLFLGGLAYLAFLVCFYEGTKRLPALPSQLASAVGPGTPVERTATNLNGIHYVNEYD